MDFFIIFLPIFLEMFKDCQEENDESDADIEQRLRNPGRREQIAIRRVLKKKKKLRRGALRAEVAKQMDELRNAEEDDIRDVMEELAELKVGA